MMEIYEWIGICYTERRYEVSEYIMFEDIKDELFSSDNYYGDYYIGYFVT